MQRKIAPKPYKPYKPEGMVRGDITTIARIKKCSTILVRKVLNGERKDCKGIKEELDSVIKWRNSRINAQ